MPEPVFETKKRARAFRPLTILAALLPVLLASWFFWGRVAEPPPPKKPPVSPPPEAGRVVLEEKPLDWIPPGTVVGKTPPKGWSHLVYAAHPRIGSGNVKEVPRSVLYYAAVYTVNCLADVERHRTGAIEEYSLEQVAIGIGTEIDGKNTIITSATQKKLGADLDIIARQVLSQCETDFRTGFLQIVRTPTMLVFDSDAILLIDGQHKKMMTRYAILVSPKTGELHTLVWLFDPDYELVDQPIQSLPPNDQEDRVLDVDADKFFLGLPREGAFAQLRLAQGTPILLTDRLKKIISPRRYTKRTARQLEEQLRILVGRHD